MSETDGESTRWLPHVGTYTRELPVSVERLYENALDWEHLPWLHRSSFSSIECLDAGAWGWRARAGLQPRAEGRAVTLELRLERSRRRWITRTLDGLGRGTEIWTHAFPVGVRRTDIVVDFFVPGVRRDDAERVGETYRRLYAGLYDEDVGMMTERQRQLDRIKTPGVSSEPGLRLGRLDEVRARVPLSVERNGRTFRIVAAGSELVAYAAVCPHQLGPLGEPDPAGVVECPWHGYRFDVRSRRCVSGQACRLAPAPQLRVDARSSDVFLDWSE